MISVRTFALTVMFASCVGCQVWQQADQPTSAMSLIEPAEDQVVLDVSFVTVSASNEQLQQAVWNEADEQVLDNDLRRRLAANGMRCGILGQSAPAALQQLLLETKDGHEADLANGTGSLEQLGDRGQQMQLRTGRLGKVVVTPGLRDEMVILSRQGDQFVGETLAQAQCRCSHGDRGGPDSLYLPFPCPRRRLVPPPVSAPLCKFHAVPPSLAHCATWSGRHGAAR